MRPCLPVLVVLLAAALPALCACEGEGPKTALGYTEDAKRAYDAAMQEFNAHNWLEAQTMMREVKRKYSYSKYARMAELRIADADFEQEKYLDAIREYKDFVHAHRSDAEDVEYARSQASPRATFSEIPESFLVGPPEERDQATRGRRVQGAQQLPVGLSGRQAGDPHVRELLAQVVARLVRHELYVARFYLAKDNYDAAVARIQYALRNYGGSHRGERCRRDRRRRARGGGAAAPRQDVPEDAQVVRRAAGVPDDRQGLPRPEPSRSSRRATTWST